MKKELSPILAIAVVVIVLFVTASVYYVAGSGEQKSIAPKGGKIVLPPSQVGTKLGGRVLGNDAPVPTIPNK